MTTTIRFRQPAVLLAVAAMIASFLGVLQPPASASHDIYVEVDGASGNECAEDGSNGTLEFPVRLLMKDPITGVFSPTLADRKITVQFETIQDGTADEGSDYAFTSDTVTINQGQHSATADVKVFCDGANESEETFSVFFFDLENAQFKGGGDDRKVTGAIQNGGTAPPGPQFFISDASPPTVTERPADSDGNLASVSFVVSISDTSDCVPLCRVTVDANDGTATASDDYNDNSDSYEWTPADDCQENPSACRETFTVTIKNDNNAEPLEQFTADLTDDPSPGTIKDGQGVAKIADDDASKVSVKDATRSEGVGSYGVPFVIDQAVGQPLYVVWHTIDGSAKDGSDYTKRTSAVTEIPANSKGANGSVAVIDDSALEAWEERFYVEIDCLETDDNTSCDNPVSESVATLGDRFGRETIQDNEPNISIGPGSGNEGDKLSFEVTLTQLREGQRISVDYETVDGTAEANEDYKPKSGSLCWDDDADDDTCSADLKKTVTVETLQDGASEGTESFTVKLTNPQFAGFDEPGDAIGTGDILDDDAFNVDAGPEKSGESAAPVSFTAEADCPNDCTYTWDFGDGTPDQTGVTVKHRFAETGTYTVRVTVEDSSGSSATDTTTATITDSGAIARSFGTNREGTAIDVSSDHWNEADTVLLATGYAHADALAAGPLAKKLDAPLLLTNPNGLPDEVKQELDRLNASTVIILGGVHAVPQEQADELAASGYRVERIADVNRFGTAADIATEVGATSAKEVTVALGQHADENRDDWPDALSAGSFASLAEPLPSLLTHSSTVPQETLDALAELDTDRIFLLGGNVAISDTVEQQLEAEGYTVQRVFGADRYATSVAAGEIVMDRYPAGQVRPVFATGQKFPDGLTGGALAGKVRGPVVLVPTDSLDNASSVRDFLRKHANPFDLGTIVGGETVVSNNVKTQARSDIDTS